MNKQIIVCTLLVLIGMQALCAQSEGSADRQLQDFPTNKIRQADMQGLKDFDTVIAKSLSQAPNDSSGKKSKWYPKLQVWKANVNRAVTTGKQEDLFQIIPGMAEYFTRDKSKEHSEHYQRLLENQMYDCGHYLIMAAGAYIRQHRGQVDATTLARLVKLFSVYGFFLESDWEEQSSPIGPQDLLIINPTQVVEQLKSVPWDQARNFTRGIVLPDAYFADYSPNGNGLAVIKAKGSGD